MLRRFLSALLLFESIVAGVYVARLVPALPGHDFSVIVVILARGVVGALQFAAGWMLAARRLPGVPLARLAFVGSAVLTTMAVGFNLAPTGVYPWWRWQFTGGYWVYALAALLALRRVSTRA